MNVFSGFMKSQMISVGINNILLKMLNDLNLKSLILKPIGGAPVVLTDIFSRIGKNIYHRSSFC